VTRGGEVVWKFINPAVPEPAPLPENASRRDQRRQKKYNNIVFRVTRFGFDFPAFQDRDITPGPLLTEYIKTNPPVRPLELPDEMKRD